MIHHLQKYESLAALSAEMLAAARASDQDALVAAQNRCAALIAELRRSPEPQLDVDHQRKKLRLIQDILANDREVRSITEPWLEQLGLRLRGVKMQRNVGNLYG